MSNNDVALRYARVNYRFEPCKDDQKQKEQQEIFQDWVRYELRDGNKNPECVREILTWIKGLAKGVEAPGYKLFCISFKDFLRESKYREQLRRFVFNTWVPLGQLYKSSGYAFAPKTTYDKWTRPPSVNEPRRVIFDLDNTLADWTGAMYKFAKTKWGIDLSDTNNPVHKAIHWEIMDRFKFHEFAGKNIVWNPLPNELYVDMLRTDYSQKVFDGRDETRGRQAANSDFSEGAFDQETTDKLNMIRNRNMIVALMDDPLMHAMIEPYMGAASYLKNMAGDNIDVLILTSAFYLQEFVIDLKVRLVRKMFGDEGNDWVNKRLIISSDKTEFYADCIVDDNVISKKKFPGAGQPNSRLKSQIVFNAKDYFKLMNDPDINKCWKPVPNHTNKHVNMWKPYGKLIKGGEIDKKGKEVPIYHEYVNTTWDFNYVFTLIGGQQVNTKSACCTMCGKRM